MAGVCDNCGTRLIQREDDSEETVRNRLRIYNDITSELIEYYRAQHLIREVPAEGTIEEVYDKVLRALGKSRQSR